MVTFKTPKLDICKEEDGRYPIRRTKNNADVLGTWRSRPRGRRLFTNAQIKAIRRDFRPVRVIAADYDCSHVTIYHIINRSIYKDVV